MPDNLTKSLAELRKEAQQQRKAGRWQDAADTFTEAIKLIDRELRVLRYGGQENHKARCDLLAEKSQIYGSIGGTWRDAKKFDQAAEAYDKGRREEITRRDECKALDSYNLLQRLVVRILRRPEDLYSETSVVDGLTLLLALQAARDEIDKQIHAGRTESWALGDLVLATILCGSSPDQALASLGERLVDRSFYESTHKTVTDLLEEGLGKGTALHQRLLEFQAFLERKGGLRAASTAS